MAQKFYEGETNHLTWVMVDATDFATPESALSAATTIKIYGKLVGNTAAPSLTASGTGSLTNDIVHAAASATGIYTIALGTGDLSDTQQSFYDQYIIALSATGAARQAIIVEGVRRGTSWFSNISNAISVIDGATSTIHSETTAASNIISQILGDTAYISNMVSNASIILSDIHSETTAASDILSQILDDTSALNVSAALNASNLSDIASRVWGEKWDVHSVASSFGSAFEVILSRTSDIESSITSVHSDLRSLTSGVGGGTASAIAAKVWSDFESKVGSTTSDMFSGLAAAAGATPSQIWGFGYSDLTEASSVGSAFRIALSNISDIRASQTTGISHASKAYSMTAAHSDILSQILGDTAYISNMVSNASTVLSDIHSTIDGNSNILSYASGVLSDLNSRITGAVATASDVASKVWAEKYTAASNTKSSTFGSLFEVIASNVSDTQSAVDSQFAALSAQISNVESLLDSQFSALSSDMKSEFDAMSNQISNIESQLDDVQIPSDVQAAMADEFLNRNLVGGGSGNTRNVRNALRTLRNKVTVDGTNSVVDVYDETDASVAWSASISTASGNPIVDVDPT